MKRTRSESFSFEDVQNMEEGFGSLYTEPAYKKQKTKKLGMLTPTQISQLKYICGHSNPDMNMVKAWAQFFGLNPNSANLRNEFCRAVSEELKGKYNITQPSSLSYEPSQIPGVYLDFLTKKPLYRPVQTSTGKIFNLETILEYAKTDIKCPETGQFLEPFVFFNKQMQDLVYEYLKKFKIQPEMPQQNLQYSCYRLQKPFEWFQNKCIAQSQGMIFKNSF